MYKFFPMPKLVKLGCFTFATAIVAAIVWTIPFGKGVAIPEES